MIATGAVSLDAFFERILAVNPFLENRVNGPAPADCDALAVHPQAFAGLTELAGQALAARRGFGAVLWGEAGIGKSHLLARLGRWADTEQRACCIYLHNLQSTPEQLPRALLRHVITVLTRGRRNHYYKTPLFALSHAGVVEATGKEARRHSWDSVGRAFRVFIDRLGREDHPGAAGFDRSIYEVLFSFFRSAYRARHKYEDGAVAVLAARWLAGQALEPHEAKLLGLPLAPRRDEPVALADAQQIKQVFVALARLATSHGQPFVLAFDQVDNLDNDQFAALTRFLEALLDSSPNLLVVTAGVRASLERWRERGVVQQSAWDRMAQFEFPLQRLDVNQAEQLVRVRLDRFLNPFAGLEAVQRRRREDTLFPLGNVWFREVFHDRHDLRPRDVINLAREGWSVEQERVREIGGVAWLARTPALTVPPPTEPVEPTAEQRRDLVDRVIDMRLAELAGQPITLEKLPTDPEHLATLLWSLLLQCREDPYFGVCKVEAVAHVHGQPPTHTLNVVQQTANNGAPVATAILVLTSTSATRVTATLRRVTRNPPAVNRFVLLTENRVGLRLGASGKRYFDKLEHQYAPHFHHVQLATSEHAALHALQTVIREARTGDLELTLASGKTVPVREAEVIASHRRHGRYRAARVLGEVLDARLKPVGAAP
jgi:hypothetical protein